MKIHNKLKLFIQRQFRIGIYAYTFKFKSITYGLLPSGLNLWGHSLYIRINDKNYNLELTDLLQIKKYILNKNYIKNDDEIISKIISITNYNILRDIYKDIYEVLEDDKIQNQIFNEKPYILYM